MASRVSRCFSSRCAMPSALRRELDRVLRNRPRPSSGPMVLLPVGEYRRLVACERAIPALPDAVAVATMEAGEMEGDLHV